MKKELLIMFMVASAFFEGCGDKGPHNISIDSGVKTAFNYMPGTYWIYKDSISGRVDSFYVTNNAFHPNADFNTDATEDNIIIAMTERNIGTFFTSDTLGWSWVLKSNYTSLVAYNSKYGDFFYTPLTVYPFVIGVMKMNDNTANSGSNYINIILPSYNLYGNSFSNVADISQSSTPSGFFNDEYFINTDIGIIKMRWNHPNDSVKNKVWELQRWHIVK